MTMKKSNAKAKAPAKSAPLTVVSAAVIPAQDTVSFDQWWMMLNRKSPQLPHLKEIIWADFRSRGLKANETKQKYDDMLKVFGITV